LFRIDRGWTTSNPSLGASLITMPRYHAVCNHITVFDHGIIDMKNISNIFTGRYKSSSHVNCDCNHMLDNERKHVPFQLVEEQQRGECMKRTTLEIFPNTKISS
jgi:hypothetical protein